MNRKLSSVLMLLAAALVVAPALPALAEVQFDAVIDGASAGTPSPATGHATLILNDAGTEVAYTITYSGLVGTETAAHFHNAPPGQNGPVLFPLPAGNPKVGVWPVSAFAVAELYAGRVYVNIHTDMYPAGEIRGDVSFTAVPAGEQSWGQVKSLFR